MGGSDRAAQLDNVGLGIFAYQVARELRRPSTYLPQPSSCAAR